MICRERQKWQAHFNEKIMHLYPPNPGAEYAAIKGGMQGSLQERKQYREFLMILLMFLARREGQGRFRRKFSDTVDEIIDEDIKGTCVLSTDNNTPLEWDGSRSNDDKLKFM